MDRIFKIVKDIPLDPRGEKKISAGRTLYLQHGAFYFDEGLIDLDWQADFKTLLRNEEQNGWNYLRPTTL